MLSQILKFSWALTLLFVIGAGVLAARLTGSILAKRLWVGDVRVSASEARRNQPIRTDSLSDYRVVEERNLFNAHPKPPPSPEQVKSAAAAAASQAQTPVVRVPLNLTLIGTAVLVGGKSFALIQSGADLKLVREGEDVAPGAKLVKVKADRILIDRGGGATDEILLYPPERAGVAARTRGPVSRARRPPQAEEPTSSETVRQVSEDKWLIDSREIQEATSNMSKLMTQIRVVPNFTDGQPDGFKIFAIRPGSLFSKIGLQNGDVLKSINGIEIQGPEQAFEAYQRLKDETSIQIDLVRRNENKTFNYEVR